MAKKRTPASCSGSCMSSNHLKVNFPEDLICSVNGISLLWNGFPGNYAHISIYYHYRQE